MINMVDETHQNLNASPVAPMKIPFINPRTGHRLLERNGGLSDERTQERIARIRDGVPVFVDDPQNYAESFGYQWHQWQDTLSDARSTENIKRNLVLERSRFDQFEMTGKSVLECGMGGGDDTEVLLQLPFAHVYSFDYSAAVFRAKKHLKDDRLTLFQASIFDIPLPDQSFDFVYCHRVIQHTPDPEQALRSIARKVKPGGVLFVHSYNRSLINMMSYKYKYRWLFRRLPHQAVKSYVDHIGPVLFSMNELMVRLGKGPQAIAYSFIPFETISRGSAYRKRLSRTQLLELAKLITFDALTPRYDTPMRWSTMQRILEELGFSIRFREDRAKSAIWCTAVRRG